MILTCPACHSSYNVPDGAVTATGRKVRCASCAHVWHATLADTSADPAPHDMPPPAAPVAPPPPPVEPSVTVTQSEPVEMDAGMAAQTAAIRKAMIEEASRDDEDDEEQDLSDGSEEFLDSETDFVEPDDHEEPEITSTDTPGDADDFDDSPLSKYMPSPDDAEEELFSEDDDLEVHDDFAEDDDLAVHDEFKDDQEDASTSFEGDSFSDDLRAKYGLDDDDDDPIMRRRIEQKDKAQRRAIKIKRTFVTSAWMLLVLVWGGLVGLIFGFPEQVKEHWPASTNLYSMLDSMSDKERYAVEEGEEEGESLAVQPQQIKISPPTIEHQMRDTTPVLVLKGIIENYGQKSVRVPMLRAVIYDGNGEPLDYWTFQSTTLILARGQQANYITSTPKGIPLGASHAGIQLIWPDAAVDQQKILEEKVAKRKAAAKAAAEKDAPALDQQN